MSENDPEARVILERVTTVLEFLRDGHTDHETRLRLQEQRPPGITPRQALGFAVAVASIIGAGVPIVSHLAN